MNIPTKQQAKEHFDLHDKYESVSNMPPEVKSEFVKFHQVYGPFLHGTPEGYEMIKSIKASKES